MSNRRLSIRSNFYPRPPRGGRPFLRPAVEDHIKISIHALREEGDDVLGFTKSLGMLFLSTPSARRATLFGSRHHRHLSDFYPRPPRGGRHLLDAQLSGNNRISIHALREEGDAITSMLVSNTLLFLSTPSARRATHPVLRDPEHGAISIHALREEGDHHRSPLHPSPTNFYPRPPRGGRRMDIVEINEHIHFYPRPPRGGRQQSVVGVYS